MSLSRGNKRAEGHIARRRNALKKETYRNSLRGIGLITREPVGFLLDLVRFHQRSHHFYLSLFSLSLCLNVAFGFFFRVGCFFSLESKTSDTQKKIQTTKKNKKKKRQTKIQRTTIHPSRERERERETTVLNTMECYFFVLRKYKQTHKS